MSKSVEFAPFSRAFLAADFANAARDIAFSAQSGELERLAAEFDVPKVAKLSARFRVSPQKGGVVATGIVEATVTQRCVVTLELFDVDLREEVSATFIEPVLVEKTQDAEISVEAPDPPEPLVNGGFDLGALAAQYVALGLDPYPRKPGVEFVGHQENSEADLPFAGLKELLAKSGKAD